jgi:hypothetical protein
MDQTARFALPYLAPGQSQKEFFHNEALARIDALLCPAVEQGPLGSPPASPVIGSCYLVGAGAAGDWAGKDGTLASFTDGGWRHISPIDGMSVVDRATGLTWTRRNSAWEAGIARVQEVRINGQAVVRERQPAIADPTGGGTVDAECRVAVGALLAALRTHGLIG